MAAERYDAVDETIGEAPMASGGGGRRCNDVLGEVAPVCWETVSVKRT